MRILVILALLALPMLALPVSAPAQGIQLITAAGQKQIVTDPGTDVLGAREPDVTVVEYFDYNCPYCKQFAPTLQSLMAEDPKVAIIYKDWPILGDVSVYAARSVLAAQWQGKYRIAHDALINGPKLAANEQVDAALEAAGINLTRLAGDRKTHAADIDALLARNDAETHALHLRGTPGVVVGRQLLPGIVDLAGLRQLVDMARQEP